MFRLGQRWINWSLLFLASLVFCFVFQTRSIGLAEHSVAVEEMQLLASPSQGQLVQQGIERYQAGKFPEAIALWQEALSEISTAKDQAIVLSNLAIAYRQTGQLSQAITQWEQAIKLYRSQPTQEMRQPLAGLLIEQAQAYSDLGQQRRAITLLQSAIETALQNQDRLTEAAAQGALGNAYWALGNYDQALAAQETSLKIARELNNASYIATALNNLGNVYASRADRYSYQSQLAELEGDDGEVTRLTQAIAQDKAKARKVFEQSLEAAQGVAGLEEVRALMNLNRLLIRSQSEATLQVGRLNVSNATGYNLGLDNNLQPSAFNDQDLIVRNRNRALELLTSAPDTREKAYALINLAQQPLKVESSHLQASSLLEQALAVAKKLGDARAESFALGSLGQLYKVSGEYDQAMELTRKAQFASQQINALDSLYRWQWEAGRILKATGAKAQAITSYEQAIATLQSIRGDLVVANQELQFDFREQVEPVYRELIELLLDSPAAAVKRQESKGKASPVNQAVDTLELLKLAELQNFFGDECVQVALSQGGGDAALTDTNTAVIYSIVLENHTEMILRSPDGSITNYPVAMGKQEIGTEINQLRYFLELRQTEEYRPQVQKIYNLLIRPLEADLAAAKPTTLVFINDGVLRTVPMGALHDGKEFLVEKYAIATTPSLSLTNHNSLSRGNLKALSLGLTVEKPPFSALKNVKAEVTAVKEILGGTELVDEAFTLPNLQAAFQDKSYPIVHMATHGKFGVDAQSTFLVGFDQRISIEKLDNLLRSRGGRQPVELLTLSACQTAAGDNRSALGIAGVAVRAGVESALATLWYINDESTVSLIEEFYRQLLQPNTTKAQALRRAQMKMIAEVNYSHPALWSPFILIGNWL